MVGAAVEMIDDRGLRELTMRSLGARLSVEAMTLYRHVPSREALLDAIVEAVVDELYGDPDVYIEPRDGWQDYLMRLAHGVRRIALAHPQVFPLVATRPPAAPWVRPPLRSLRWVESFLQALLKSGFSDRGAVAAYRAFSSFLLGHLLLEVFSGGVDTGPVEEADPDHRTSWTLSPIHTSSASSLPCLRLTPQRSSRSPWRISWSAWKASRGADSRVRSANNHTHVVGVHGLGEGLRLARFVSRLSGQPAHVYNVGVSRPRGGLALTTPPRRVRTPT